MYDRVLHAVWLGLHLDPEHDRVAVKASVDRALLTVVALRPVETGHNTKAIDQGWPGERGDLHDVAALVANMESYDAALVYRDQTNGGRLGRQPFRQDQVAQRDHRPLTAL